MAKKKRKVRVSKTDTIRIREENKKTSYQRKKLIIPGPWTNIETSFKVKARLRENKSSVMAEILGPSFGSYSNDTGWTERGWYPIVFNLEAPKMKKIIDEHGIDNFLAASEKALNEIKNKKGKSLYGRIIITSLCVDNSGRTDVTNRFISCRGKTNSKKIKGFRAIRKGLLVTL